MRNIKRTTIYGIIFVLFFTAIVIAMGMGSQTEETQITISASYEIDDMIQVYYSETEVFCEAQSILLSVSATQNIEDYTVMIPNDMSYIRVDFGNMVGNKITIYEIIIEDTTENQEGVISGYDFGVKLQESIMVGSEIEEVSMNGTVLVFTDADPNILVEMSYLESYFNYAGVNIWSVVKYIVSAILAAIITLFVFKFVFLKDIYVFLKDILQNRKLLLSLAINDFKVKFAGSYFGIVWAFVQPICTIAVFWFVFEMGFRSGAVSEVPFALWLSVGLVPWFFFSDAWNGATNTFMEYSYLVKKVVFKIEILPLVKILSALFVHLFFIGFLCVLFLANGVALTINVVGVFYYMICLIAFIIGLSFVTSSVVVFFKDLTQIIGIILQFGMWLTPIMWQVTTFPENIVNIMRINPMFYIIEGYRSCFITSEAIPSVNQAVYFWFITVLMFMVGIALFRRLKPHFADVL